MNKYELVSKEEIKNFKFPKTDVLIDIEEIKRRRIELERSTVLGNIEQQKVFIYFEDEQGLKKVETTIWATTEKNIALKSGVHIPIHRIHKIV